MQACENGDVQHLTLMLASRPRHTGHGHRGLVDACIRATKARLYPGKTQHHSHRGSIVILLKGQMRLNPKSRKEPERKATYQLSGCCFLDRHNKNCSGEGPVPTMWERAVLFSKMSAPSRGQPLSSQQTCVIREEHVTGTRGYWEDLKQSPSHL